MPHWEVMENSGLRSPKWRSAYTETASVTCRELQWVSGLRVTNDVGMCENQLYFGCRISRVRVVPRFGAERAKPMAATDDRTQVNSFHEP